MVAVGNTALRVVLTRAQSSALPRVVSPRCRRPNRARRPAAVPDLQVVLIGRSAKGEPTSSSLGGDEHARLLAHPVRPVDGFDRDLDQQLALVEACEVFCSPHSGFGMAALDYVPALLRGRHRDPSAIWSIDSLHTCYI